VGVDAAAGLGLELGRAVELEVGRDRRRAVGAALVAGGAVRAVRELEAELLRLVGLVVLLVVAHVRRVEASGAVARLAAHALAVRDRERLVGVGRLRVAAGLAVARRVAAEAGGVLGVVLVGVELSLILGF